MPNAELLIKEAEGLPPEYFTELLDFARFLKQKAGTSHAAQPPYGGIKSIPIGKRPEGTYAAAPEWQPPPDSDFWEDRVKAGLDPDAWRKLRGKYKGEGFSSEDLFKEDGDDTIKVFHAMGCRNGVIAQLRQ
jgi:hypothetical protein